MNDELDARFTRIEKQLDDLRLDWKRDLDMIISALRVIGAAVDVRDRLDSLIEKVELAAKDKGL